MAVALAAVALGAIASGCGANFPLPTEVRLPGDLPGERTYQRIDTWYGMEGINDMVLIPGPQLFLLFRAAAGQPARVVEYKTTTNEPLPTRFEGTINPNALCIGANRLFVLDQGDTAAARTNFACVYTADCGPLRGFSRPIVDVGRYWHVNEYLLDGTLSSTFTDTTLSWVNGIAADDQGGVYVSGVLMVCVVDPFDTRLKTLDSQFRIYRYVRGAAGPPVIGPWHRDTGYEVIQGTGIGSTIDPRGLFWANHGGSSLYFADLGNNEAQKYDRLAAPLNSFKLDAGGVGADSLLLRQPLDVTADRAGNVYVCDTGNGRVLRYNDKGDYVQRVDIEPDLQGNFLIRPVAVAADTELVYVADPGSGVLARFRRRK
jgi:DNA-binding beta-propeller fold protein YncE